MSLRRALACLITVIAAGACGDDAETVLDGSPSDGAVVDSPAADRSTDVTDDGATIDARDNDVSNDAPGGDAGDDGPTDGDGQPPIDAPGDALMDARSGDAPETSMDVLGGDVSMDATSGDGAGDSGDGGCPMAGTLCSPAEEGMACGQCPNPCAFCWIVRCSGGIWTALEVPPLPPSLCRDGGDAAVLRIEVAPRERHVSPHGQDSVK